MTTQKLSVLVGLFKPVHAIIFLALFTFFGSGCGSDTRIAVKNAGEKDSKIKVRDGGNTSVSEVDFGEIASGATSGCKTIEYDSYSGLNVNATDNHENGTVSVEEGEDSLIVVYNDGTEPAASVSDGLCD